jgi:prevent-host-death family protein
MTLHKRERQVGVRELHDKLSAYLEMVEGGSEVIVTRRGRRVARLSASGVDPFGELAERGLIRMPRKPRSQRRARLKSSGGVSDLVAEQRR